MERPIYVRNVDGMFNKERPIKYIVDVMDQDSKGLVKKQLLYWVTQENSIEFLRQSSLPYIL